MREIMSSIPEIDDRVASTIALAMRQVAQADGEHPRELALIEQFEATIQDGGSLELELIDSDDLREAFVKSLVLVAFADGAVSDAEGAVIGDLAAKVGMAQADVAGVVADVAQALISRLSGVKVFREQVVTMGMQMGLDEATVRSVLE